MDDDEKDTIFVHSKSYPPIFFLTTFLILDRERIGIKKHIGSALETDFAFVDFLSI